MEYLLNINTRTIHNANSKMKQCRLNMIREDNKKVFSDYYEAKNYLPSGKRSATPCSICLGADYEQKIKSSDKKNK